MSSLFEDQAIVSECSAPSSWWQSDSHSGQGQSRVGDILSATVWFVGGNPAASGRVDEALRAWLREDDTPTPGDTRLLSEASLAVDWSRPEEAEAWAFMQEPQEP